MATVEVPAGETVTLAETAYTVQVENTGLEKVVVGGTVVESGGRLTVYPVAWQPVTASSEKGGTLDVTVTSLGSAEPVTLEAVSHEDAKESPAAEDPASVDENQKPDTQASV